MKAMGKAGAMLCAFAAAGAAQAADTGWHGGAWLTTDYQFRGATQSDAHPAAQGELYYAFENGFYAGAWGSSVDYVGPGDEDDGVDIEIDPYVGVELDLTDRLAADLMLVRQVYPTSVDGVDYDYTELEAKLWLDERAYAHLGYSNDVFNAGEDGLYVSAGVEWPIGATDLSFLASAGWYSLDDAAGDDYGDWMVGLGGELSAFTWKVQLVDAVSYGGDLPEVVGPPADYELLATFGIEF